MKSKGCTLNEIGYCLIIVEGLVSILYSWKVLSVHYSSHKRTNRQPYELFVNPHASVVSLLQKPLVLVLMCCNIGKIKLLVDESSYEFGD